MAYPTDDKAAINASPVVYRRDPALDEATLAVEFALTYSGPLWGAQKTNPRAKHKHDLRRHWHRQINWLFHNHPIISRWSVVDPDPAVKRSYQLSSVRAREYERCGYRFVPLVTERDPMLCDLEITMLRPDGPGSIIKSADIDNRLKTLFDSLRMAGNISELGGVLPNIEDDGIYTEDPFYCLLEDDRLISGVSVNTGLLLEPTPGNRHPKPDDVRLIIKVKLSWLPQPGFGYSLWQPF